MNGNKTVTIDLLQAHEECNGQDWMAFEVMDLANNQVGFDLFDMDPNLSDNEVVAYLCYVQDWNSKLTTTNLECSRANSSECEIIVSN